MTSFNYSRAQATALRLLEKFGQAGSVVRDMPGSGPVWNPGEAVPTPHPCTLAVLKFDNRDIDGTLIKNTDLKIYVAAKDLAITPTTTDRATIGGSACTIIRVIPLSPAGMPVYFELQCRQ